MCLLELLTVKLNDFCVDKDLETELCVRIDRLTDAGVPLTNKISREESVPILQVCSHILHTVIKYCKNGHESFF